MAAPLLLVAVVASALLVRAIVRDKPTRPPDATRPSTSFTPAPTIAAATPGQRAPTSGAYDLTRVMPQVSFDRMVDLVPIPGRPDEAIVLLQKRAQIWRVSLSDGFAPSLYGDLSGYVGGGGEEEGLLSAAFSPNFQDDGRLYVYYTQGGASGRPTVLARFPVSNDAIDVTRPTVVLEVPDFAANHNGGRALFGPDGYLYLSTGDGGGAGDPEENGRNKDSLLGKILRIDVTRRDTYAAPPDNPFVNASGADEVWAYGLRNPWRISFDRQTGDLWLGDVGQNRWEEIDRIVKGGNYGWDCYEGFDEFEAADCPSDGLQWPRAVYSHSDGASVIGGYVYRGSALPELDGWYVYGDAYSGKIWALDTSADSGSEPILLTETGRFISSFAETPDGELLVVTFDSAIFRLDRK